MDPERVAPCGPGYESVQIIDASHFNVKATVRVGPIAPSFLISFQVLETTEPEIALLSAHGEAPGTAVDARASMTLSEKDQQTTVMDWSTDVQLSGALATLGSRLIQMTASKLIRQTFDCIKASIGQPAESQGPR